MNDNYEEGTIRIRTKDLRPIIKTKNSWKRGKFDTTGITHIIDLFKAHDNFEVLIDSKDNRFIKGLISPEGAIIGQRIGILPDGQKIDKAYSLFAKDLTIHDEKSNSHWDVIFRNPNGKFAYLYTLEKKEKSRKKKYAKVNDFDRHLPKLKKNINLALNKGEEIALPMNTLLETYMRVGNEIYYKAHGHKGLTTLQKGDIKIGNDNVKFEYPGKDGVPRKILAKFSPNYIKKLTNKIKKLKRKDFIFTNKNGHPIRDTEFEKAFLKYCGEKFYPHIVRSHYATKTTQNFLKNNPSPTKEEVKKLYLEVADKLGHKKFSKKKNEWESCYTVTIHHYIAPDLVEEIERRVQ